MTNSIIELSKEQFLVNENDPIKKVFEKIDQNTFGIVFVVNSHDILLGSISDGDIRRAIISLGFPALKIKNLCNYNVFSERKKNLPENWSRIESSIQTLRAVPLTNDDNKIVSILVPERLTKVKQDADFIIMAGGRGTRLFPLTEDTPKPMLIIKGKPMIEHIVYKAIKDGFENIIVSVNYKKEQIIDYLQDGSKWGVNIQYIEEDKPLGTAGALSLWKADAPYLVVTNCDIITDLSYLDVLNFTKEKNAIATMAVYNLTTDIDFGVVEVDGFKITGFREKPKLSHLINSGVYCLRRDAMNYINLNNFLDMPTLFSLLADDGHQTYVMPMFESWADIGRHEDLENIRS
ncbi:nucleotidyltransferase family protein [Amylibacter sp.]|nr:nucleotidyltransferase family protein [Amylibacter sp.]MDB9785457.1 nucleotidyltransferase family protein [Amylibacter sp.]